MAETLLHHLIHLSKVDASLARIFAEKKRLEATLTAKEAELKKTGSERDARSKISAEKKKRYVDEEKAIKDEQGKLADRRKALDSLANYKLQQAALREIDYANRQLGGREDAVLKLIEESDAAEKAFKDTDAIYKTALPALEALRKETSEGLVELEKRRSEKAAEREQILPKVLPANLTIYDRIKTRFPGDAMVAVTNGSCTGCFIQVAHQLMVEIHKGESVVRCRGCGRILYLDPNSASTAEAAAK